jgi:hypothetical protein
VHTNKKMNASSKFLYVFNKLFSSFIKTLKDVNEEVKPIIKKHYKVIDKASPQYYDKFWASVEPKWKDFVEMDSLYETDNLNDVEVAQDICIHRIFTSLDDGRKDMVSSHVYLLLVFAYLYTEIKKEDVHGETEPEVDVSKVNVDTQAAETAEATKTEVNASHTLFNNVVSLLSLIQTNQKDTDAYKEILDSIVDDDIVRLLSKIKTVAGTVPKQFDTSSAGNNPMEFLQGLENSKIASLAKEITSEIDLSNLNIDKPEDISKLMDMSDGNNFLGNIVSKVSNKLTEKLNTGELKQEDLMNEAMSVMGALNNGDGLGGLLKSMGGLGGLGGLGDIMSNPMMAEMMKMAKKGKVQTKNTNGSRNTKGSRMSTRDRLKKKLDERNKAEQNQ